MAEISSNNPFSNQPNVRRGSGPVYYKWKAPPFEKSGQKIKQEIVCNGKVDNVVTYVYNELPNGDHSTYVFCDYVI